MEQTTLQERIEERASLRLKEHLLEAYQAEQKFISLIGKENCPPALLSVYDNRWREYGKEIHLGNEKTKEIFNTLLPNFIRIVTDEVLKKIDEIDYLLESQKQIQEY